MIVLSPPINKLFLLYVKGRKAKYVFGARTNKCISISGIRESWLHSSLIWNMQFLNAEFRFQGKARDIVSRDRVS